MNNNRIKNMYRIVAISLVLLLVLSLVASVFIGN